MIGSRTTTEPAWIRFALVSAAFLFLGLFLVAPLVTVFVSALEKGAAAYLEHIREPEALDAVLLTLLVTLVSLPASLLFGLAAAWMIARFEFPGKSVLTTLIDLPFAVSPVIAGLALVLLYGTGSSLGAWLDGRGIRVIFATPGIVLATMFVTLPFVARELIPLMQAQGADEEEAALVLGAGGVRTFLKVTLPNIKWGFLYGVILCNARAIGEFGAVSVVSGHIRGATNTLPLHVEILYNEYNFTAAFAVASLLTLIALVTLVAKGIMERGPAPGREVERVAAPDAEIGEQA